MNEPEAPSEYYQFNVTQPPMDDVRVRKAFNHGDRQGAHWRSSSGPSKPLTGFVPEGIFPGYPHPQGRSSTPARARALLAEAGFRDAQRQLRSVDVPVGDVGVTTTRRRTTAQTAEFVQAQWKQNLGLTMPLRNMEFRTFLSASAHRREYKGIARGGWVGDYMDPFTFLDLFSTPAATTARAGSTRDTCDMLADANREPDPAQRYEAAGARRAYLLDAQPSFRSTPTRTNWLKKPYVKGMYANPITMHPWKFVYIEHDPARWD